MASTGAATTSPQQTGPELLAAIAAASSQQQGVPALVQRLKQQQPPEAFLLMYQNEEGSSVLHAAVSLADHEGGLALLRCLVEDVGGGSSSSSSSSSSTSSRDETPPLALRDGRMRSPLLLAAEKGNATAFLYLWGRQEGGAEAAAADCFGRGPLHWWCKHGDVACVMAVVEGKGADVNACTTSGETPLVWALQAAAAGSAAKEPRDIEAVVRLLLDKAADARAATKGMGQRPLDMLPPAGRGNELQERLRGMLEARVRAQEEEEYGSEEAPVSAPAEAAEAAAAAVAAAGTAPAAGPTKPATGSLMSFAGKGLGPSGVGSAAGGRGTAVGAGPAKRLKIKLKGQE